VRVAQSLGPQRVAIPDVTGQSERVAELNVRRRGLDLGSMAQVNLAEVAADQVASQSPPANASGVAVPKINLLVSRGPEPAAFVMPNFVGQPLGSVTLALQDAGIKVGRVSVAPAAPPVDALAAPLTLVPAPLPGAASMIVTQSPGAGQKVVAGSTVSFEVR
jgi:beta-lactam-binding protein with PASTA domain